MKGLSALASSFGIYYYLPYISLFWGGATAPILAGCLAAYYGMNKLNEQQVINKIEIVKEGDYEGYLRINFSKSLLSYNSIIVDIREVFSLVSLSNNDLGEDDGENNVIVVNSHIDESTGTQVFDPLLLNLLGDAHRDKEYMEWFMAKKENDDTTSLDFEDLMR